MVLSPRQSPALKLVAIAVICLFWNGIVSVFLYHVVTSWSAGRGEVCMSIFLIPFLAVGVGLIVGLFYTLLALFNPRCTLALDRADLRLGDAVEFRWSFTGRAERIGRLVLRVEGREEATYRQGTNTRTDKNVFYVLEVFDTSRPADVRAGKARWTVPADTMHSFSAANNKVVWVLVVHGHIAGWPDVKDEYVLNIAPLPGEKVGLTPAPTDDVTPGEQQVERQDDARFNVERDLRAESERGRRWT